MSNTWNKTKSGNMRGVHRTRQILGNSHKINSALQKKMRVKRDLDKIWHHGRGHSLLQGSGLEWEVCKFYANNGSNSRRKDEISGANKRLHFSHGLLLDVRWTWLPMAHTEEYQYTCEIRAILFPSMTVGISHPFIGSLVTHDDFGKVLLNQ